jgi:hypothetical protein
MRTLIGYLPAQTIAEEEVNVFEEDGQLFCSSETITYQPLPVGRYDQVLTID